MTDHTGWASDVISCTSFNEFLTSQKIDLQELWDGLKTEGKQMDQLQTLVNVRKTLFFKLQKINLIIGGAQNRKNIQTL